jgi:flagellin-like protein
MTQQERRKIDHVEQGEKRAISPVIGVILMVAITVILAAVIASFVLGLSDINKNPPQASFSCDDGAITMGSGNTLDPNQVVVDGKKWAIQDTDIGSRITAGDKLRNSEIPSTGVITWQSRDGGLTTTLFNGC